MKNDAPRPRKIGLIAAVVCAALIAVFAVMYFGAYANPYMQQNMADISDGWLYSVGAITDGAGNADSADNAGAEEPHRKMDEMDVLRQVDVPPYQRLHLFRALGESFPDAALMLKSNHQWLRVFLIERSEGRAVQGGMGEDWGGVAEVVSVADGELIFESPYDPAVKNPGMGLHFILLPHDYEGKLLHIEMTSPYAAYSGAPSSVYIGDIPSLQAYALFSRSLPRNLLMAYCLAAGAFMMALAILRRKRDPEWWGNFCFGVFSVLWGFYFPSGSYIAHQFLSPLWVSLISIGLYFLYPLPLMLYFYSRFSPRRRKAFLPAVVLMGAFVAVSFGAQVLGLADFPDMLIVFNPLYILCTVYLIALGFAEIKKGNPFLRFAVPWITLVFLISMQGMVSFYTTRIRQDETLYEMAVFSLIMVVWIYNIAVFLRARSQEQRDLMELNLKNAALERYNQTKTEFLQNMSHEMKAPLTVIATGIDFADQEINAEDGSISEASDALEAIRAETQRLGRMVGGMAELALINEMSENRRRVDFAELMRGGAQAFRFAMAQNGNSLSVEIAPDMPDVFVETDQFAQVVANLLANATDYTRNGQISLTADFDDEYITVHVADTGDGIPPDVLAKAFERGVSGRGNTGYGLYICKTVVEAHGGTIEIESQCDGEGNSQSGSGTVVTFTVPVYGGQEAGHSLN